MKRLQPYLIFAGSCEEALTFYAGCLGGEIVSLRRYADSPLEAGEEHGDRVFDAAFRAGKVRFRASDNFPGQPLQRGTNFAMFVAFSDASEQARAFDALADGGRALMPLSDGFGMLEDRFEVRWMLALEDDG